MAKSNTIKRDRISAEGLIVALEHLTGLIMTSGYAKKGHSGKTISLSHLEITRKNGRMMVDTGDPVALLFVLTHPWVELHTKAGVCGNSKEVHELEYKEMLAMVKAVFRAWDLSTDSDGDSEDEED